MVLIAAVISRKSHTSVDKIYTDYSWGFRIGYPAIAGPPKDTPAIAGY